MEPPTAPADPEVEPPASRPARDLDDAELLRLATAVYDDPIIGTSIETRFEHDRSTHFPGSCRYFATRGAFGEQATATFRDDAWYCFIRTLFDPRVLGGAAWHQLGEDLRARGACREAAAVAAHGLRELAFTRCAYLSDELMERRSYVADLLAWERQIVADPADGCTGPLDHDHQLLTHVLDLCPQGGHYMGP